jgi:hypothetical protein
MSQTDEPESVADLPPQPHRAGLLAKSWRLIEKGRLLGGVSAKMIATSRRLMRWGRDRRSAEAGPADPDRRG